MESIKNGYRDKYFAKFSEMFTEAKNHYMRENSLSFCPNSTIVKIIAEHLGLTEIMINKQISSKDKVWGEGERAPFLAHETIMKLFTCEQLNFNYADLAELAYFAGAHKASPGVLQYIDSLEKRVKAAEGYIVQVDGMEEYIPKDVLESMVIFFKCKRDNNWNLFYREIRELLDSALARSRLENVGAKEGDRLDK